MLEQEKDYENNEDQTDQEVTFTNVCVYRHNHVHITSIVDELENQNIDHALTFSWINEEWTYREVKTAVGALCVVEEPNPRLLNLGIDGEITIFNFPGFSTEKIDHTEDGPSHLVHLRCIRSIGTHVYAAGMARRVYRRETPNKWVTIDHGVFMSREQRERAIGFNSIDGLHEQDIYAVGYGGEIWFFNGNKWIQQESPTNIVLTGIKCIPDGEVYVCGMAGIILQGKINRWEIIEQDITKEDFWGITYFNKNIYLSNYDGVFKLDDDNLVLVDMGLSSEVSTAYLDANDGVLWSVGEKDLVYTKDGKNWTVVENP